MAEICHFENRLDVIFCCWESSDLDKISQTGAEWHVDFSDMVILETRCRISIWRTFGRIPWHVSQSHMLHCRVLPPGEFSVMIPDLRVTMQGASSWWIRCHDSRATCALISPVDCTLQCGNATILAIVTEDTICSKVWSYITTLCHGSSMFDR